MPRNEPLKNERIHSLRLLLNDEREAALARVREYRSEQRDEAGSPPGDELDEARALADIETEASLIERAEERLRSIDFALDLLEQGRYGICTKCGEEIPLQRLKILPFAAYCIDCQRKRNRLPQVGAGTLDEPFAHQWDLPEEMRQSTESSQDEFIPLAEEGEGEESSAPGGISGARRRGRPRGRSAPREAHPVKQRQKPK
jgi:RNA polymerase-binding transcription factor